MDIFSGTDPGLERIGKFVGGNTGRAVLAVEPLTAWNSRVFKVILDGGSPVLVKAYGAGRLAKADVEFTALGFLRAHGVRRIPAPLFRDADGLCAYEFIDGRKLEPEEIGVKEAGEAVSLLAGIARAAAGADYRALPEAAESCFSLAQYVRNLDARLERLQRAAPAGGLRDFLGTEAAAFRKDVLRHIEDGCAKYGLEMERELPREKRFPSPSDVGFHNILADRAGALYFIDFEYFGWDDPAKTASDFLLEPAVPFPGGLRRAFLEGFGASRAGADADLKKRLALVYPLLGLKWSLIMLNDFLPESPRRTSAPTGQLEPHLKRQLEKSREKLEKTAGEYKVFSELAMEVL